MVGLFIRRIIRQVTLREGRHLAPDRHRARNHFTQRRYHTRVIYHIAVTAGWLAEMFGNALYLLFMFVTRKKAGGLHRSTLILHITQAIGLQLGLGKRCMIKRIKANAPSTGRYQYKWLVETHQVWNQRSRTIV